MENILGGRARGKDRVLDILEDAYRRYHRPECIRPDPLEVVRRYADPRDQEIAGLVAALLAYGGVKAIVRSASAALERLGPSPARTLRQADSRGWARRLRGFRHRWTTETEIVGLLKGARVLLRRHGSLRNAFRAGYRPEEETLLPALQRWTDALCAAGGAACRKLVPDPVRGSACKRLLLYLRWMIRRDEVDPGAWRGLSPSKLVVPLDVHMHRAARRLGLTRRRSADLRTALEVTAAFRRLCPEDPARWDFALTRAEMLGRGGGRYVARRTNCGREGLTVPRG